MKRGPIVMMPTIETAPDGADARDHFCRAVRALRQEARATQTELAEAAGISQAVIARIEGGRSREIRLSTAARIAEVFRDWLGIGLDDMTRPDDPARRAPRW